MLILLIAALAVSPQPPLALDFDAATSEQSLKFLVVDRSGVLTVSSPMYKEDANGFARLCPISSSEAATARLKSEDLKDLRVTARLRVEPGEPGKPAPEARCSGIVLRRSADRALRAEINAAGAVRLVVVDGKQETILASAPLKFQGEHAWHTLEATALGAHIRVKADNVDAIDVLENSTMAAGRVELHARSATGDFDDLVVTELPPPHTAVLQVKGMMCELCEAKIEAAVRAVKGVTGVRASHATGVCLVELDPEHPAEIAEIMKVIEAKHYTVSHEGA